MFTSVKLHCELERLRAWSLSRIIIVTTCNSSPPRQNGTWLQHSHGEWAPGRRSACDEKKKKRKASQRRSNTALRAPAWTTPHHTVHKRLREKHARETINKRKQPETADRKKLPLAVHSFISFFSSAGPGEGGPGGISHLINSWQAVLEIRQNALTKTNNEAPQKRASHTH